jgi:hypothetical protein
LVREDAPLSFPMSCKVSVHLGVQQHTHPLQMSVMDYTFKISVLAGELERGVLPSPSTTATTMAALTSPAPAPTLTLTVGSFGGDYLCLIKLFLC